MAEGQGRAGDTVYYRVASLPATRLNSKQHLPQSAGDAECRPTEEPVVETLYGVSGDCDVAQATVSDNPESAPACPCESCQFAWLLLLQWLRAMLPMSADVGSRPD